MVEPEYWTLLRNGENIKAFRNQFYVKFFKTNQYKREQLN